MNIHIGDIEKNVPSPNRESGGRPRGAVRNIMDKMNAGDSVYFGFGDSEKRKVVSRIKGVANVAARKSGVKFTTAVGDCGIRVWRTL